MLVTKTAKTVTNISKLSPTHFVSNIRRQHRCSQFWPWIISACVRDIINLTKTFFAKLKSTVKRILNDLMTKKEICLTIQNGNAIRSRFKSLILSIESTLSQISQLQMNKTWFWYFYSSPKFPRGPFIEIVTSYFY